MYAMALTWRATRRLFGRLAVSCLREAVKRDDSATGARVVMALMVATAQHTPAQTAASRLAAPGL